MIYNSKTRKYELIKKLGEGESGITYLVKSENKKFVLKELKITNLERWTIVERFKKEIEILKTINHKGIPKFIDIIEDTKSLAYVQEYIDGKTFKEMIEDKDEISDIDFKEFFLQALDILNYLHKMLPPVIHQDISPKNIIISNKKLYLIDFGSVKTAIVREKTQTLTTVGTFGYMAPEQIMGKAIISSDIFSLGMTFLAIKNNKKASDFELEATTGALDTKFLLKLIPKDFKNVIKKSISPALKYRFQSIDEILRFISFTQTSTHYKKIDKRKLVIIPIIFLLTLMILYIKSLILTNGVLKRYGTWFTGHGNLINKIAFSISANSSHILGNEFIYKIKVSNNKKYIISSSNKAIILWNYNTQKIISKIATTNFSKINFSDDDNYIYFIEKNKLNIFNITENKIHSKLNLNRILLNYDEDIEVKDINCSIIQKQKDQIICVTLNYKNKNIPIYSINIKTQKVNLIKTINGAFIENFFYLKKINKLAFSIFINYENNEYKNYLYDFKTQNLKEISLKKNIASVSKNSNLIMLKTGILYSILKDNSLKLKCNLANEFLDSNVNQVTKTKRVKFAYSQNSYISDSGKIVITWESPKAKITTSKINVYSVKSCKFIKKIDINNKLVDKIILIDDNKILVSSNVGYLELIKIEE